MFQRAILALLCTTLALPSQAQRYVKPETDDPQTKVQAPPDFRPPSAYDCKRPVQTRIVPNAQVQREQGRSRPVIRPEPDAAREVRATGSTALRADVAIAPPAYVPAPEISIKAPAPAAALDHRQQPAQIVTAGLVDDNADFGEYLAFRARTQVEHRERDIRERYLLQVKDARGHGVADAEVAVRSQAGVTTWARTDTAGRVWLHPDAFDPAHSERYDITARKAGQQASTQLQRGQKSAVELRLPVTQSQRARLDLVFLVDATGSMDDEIDKLRASLQGIVKQISALPSQPDLCLGLVAYRDKVDEFLIKAHDLSNDVPGFQRALNQLRADGGGDYPEAMNEALDDTVRNISWRNEGATRLVVLLADAPPHLDYGGVQYDQSMMTALGKGIKIFSVGASGLDKQGEYIQRQIAQYTGGRFVFLTYANAADPSSGPGRETVHDVQNYGVDTLDRLIVRLVSQELANLK
ncbi:VWA domain-containing protein [Burkholderiaceae bacterium UC74_6]